MLPFPPTKNWPWNTSGANEKIQHIATSDVKTTVTNDVKSIIRSDDKNIATSDDKNIASIDVEKLRSLLQSNPRIQMLNQRAIQSALCTIKQRDTDYKVG